MRQLLIAVFTAIMLSVIGSPASAGPCTVPPANSTDGWCSD